MTEIIRGYRPLPERKLERQYSVNNLTLNHEQAKALKNLTDKVTAEEMKKERGEGPGIPCVGRFEEFSGDNLMSERDAQLTCAGCPAFRECDIFRIIGKPAHGIYAGVRKNMVIEN